MANRYWVGGTGNWSDNTQWSTSSGGAPGGVLLIESFQPTSTTFYLINNNTSNVGKARAEIFTGTGSAVGRADLYVAKDSGQTGNAYAKIYAITGTMGSTAKPTGAALATSDAVNLSTINNLGTPPYNTTFNFSGANQITLTNGTNYAIAVEYLGTTLNQGIYLLARNANTPGRNSAVQSATDSSWTASADRDYLFDLYSNAADIVPTETDDVIFDANSFNAGSQVVTLDDYPSIKSMNWTGVTNNPTLEVQFYDFSIRGGSLTFVSGMSVTSNDPSSATWEILPRGETITITTGGLTIPGYYMNIYTEDGYADSVVNLADGLNLFSVDGWGYVEIYADNGMTFNTNNHDIAVNGSFYIDDLVEFNVGTSTITVDYDLDLGYSTYDGPDNLSADNATFVMTGVATGVSAGYFYATEHQTVGNLNITGPYIEMQNYGCTVNNLTISPGATVYAGTGDTPITIEDSFNANGTVADPITIIPDQDTNVYRFDGTVTDPNSNWANDANVADSSSTTFATATASSTTASNFIQIAGTAAPAGNTSLITAVDVTLIIDGSGTGNAAIYTSGLGELLGTATSSSGAGTPVSLSTPSGGWTWTKLDGLTAKCYGSAGLKVAYLVMVVRHELSPTAAQFTKAPSTVRTYNMILRDVDVEGGAAWYAYNSTDNGGNSGWIFADATDYNVNDGGFITLW